MNKLITAIAALILSTSTAVYASTSTCTGKYFNDTLPVLQNVQSTSTEVCFKSYAVLFDAKDEVPYFSAEHLTAEQIQEAKEMKRKNAFHAQSNVQGSSTPKQYSKTGYDMGHMAPSGDMPDADSQYESFSMVNMTPQLPKLNRIIWKGYEEDVRALALKYGELYVVTGEIPSSVQMNGVMVPAVIYKGVYIPSTKESFVYTGTDQNDIVGAKLQVKDFDKKYGINIFPTIQ